LKDYEINVAVETGSCMYSTTKWLGDNFQKVLTVEINNDFAKFGRNKISGSMNVFPFIDDSVAWINNTLKNIIYKEDRCIYFLDAHWNEHCPLLEEIEGIANIKQQPPIIVIHDFFTGNEEFGYDSYKGQPFTWDWISPSIKALSEKIGVEYKHYFNKEATGAKRGLIYIVPKK
jgi:hypothetical protein